jgi:hypothetical protein
MSRTEILKELPKLNAQDRRKILERICDLEESELAAAEKAFLDRRLAECRGNPDAWTRWEDAKPRILSRLVKR